MRIQPELSLEAALGAWGPLAFDRDACLWFAQIPDEDAGLRACSLVGNTHAQYLVTGDAGTLSARSGAPAGASKGNKTAIIPIVGTVTPFGVPKFYELFGIQAASLPNIIAAARAAANDAEVSRLVLVVHSPGGSVFGVGEAYAALREVAARKPMVAHVNYLAASAAYWLAAAADEIIAAPSALVGSVGVRAQHVDVSRSLDRDGVTVTEISTPASKVDLSPYKPLSDAARAEIQRIVDEGYSAFAADISAARGVDMGVIGEQYGRIAPTAEALRIGLIDRIATLEAVLSEGKQAGDLTVTRRARLSVANLQRN